MHVKKNIPVFCLFVALIAFSVSSFAAPQEKPAQNERCPVCGMFVAKYDNWITQVRHADGSILFFDGMKDLFVYYFAPRQHGGTAPESISEIWAKDYYTLQWINAREAFFVVGSDVYGPMGHEFIPFASSRAAEAFLKDHHGKEILPFDAVTEDRVQSMRMGQKMRH